MNRCKEIFDMSPAKEDACWTQMNKINNFNEVRDYFLDSHPWLFFTMKNELYDFFYGLR